MKVKKGENVILTANEYSDYTILDGLVAVVGFDTDVIVNLYLDTHPKQADAGEFETEDFQEWLISHSIAKRLDMTEWYVSMYGCANVKLSSKHQSYQDACIKKRFDKAEAERMAHPENYIATGADNILVADGPKDIHSFGMEKKR